MRVIHLIIGCALCIVGIGGAAATSAVTQDPGGSAQTLIDNGSASSGSAAGGGDATGLSRDCPPTSNDNIPVSASPSGNDHSSGGAVAPSPGHGPHLGWQSLLPGSIQ